jgi:predicted phage terminase large subunit-like protein
MTSRVSPAAAATELLMRRKARRSLIEFGRARGFEPAPHHRLLCAELEALIKGDDDLLLIEWPPGSAKSTWVNYLFPAWYLARAAGADVLTASHSSELAERWGRKTRNLVGDAGKLLGVALSSDSTAANRWATVGGGEYYAVGVGVGILGFRAALGIIDDPFGSREDAESKRIRDRVWDWYINDFSSRLRPGAKRVIMHQRFHEDDLAGRVAKQMDEIGKPYRRLKIRAESLGPDDDPLGRPAGVMLWDEPSGYDYGRFLRDRKAETAGDSRTWSALYQQDPVPDTGNYFKREWLLPVDVVPPKESLRLYGGSDYAVTGGGGDYTVHGVLGLDSDGNPWMVDIWRKQASSEEWVEALCDLVIKWKPMGWAEETGQIKSGVGPFLEREMRARKAYVAREQFPTRGDKAVRAQSFRGLVATRGLRIPANAPWRGEFESELLRFPAGVHDDIVDCLGLIGQLLDTMIDATPPKEEKPKVQDGYGDRRQRSDDFDVMTI